MAEAIGKLRSEQAPGSGVQPHYESDKTDYGFLGPFWCNKKLYPEREVSCGSYELLVNIVSHPMNEKFKIQNQFSFLCEILWTFWQNFLLIFKASMHKTEN